MRQIFFLFLLLISVDLFGTGQIPDYLIYKGDTLRLYANPLESYFNFWHKRPTKLFDEIGYNSTATWRGYIGYWELRNDSLFLKRLEGDSCDIDLSLIFKKSVKNGEVFAYWVNEKVLNPYGKRLYYIHMGYSSFYEFEREFIFKKGILKDTMFYDNSKSKISQYTEDPILLKEFITSNINYSNITNEPYKNSRVVLEIQHVTEEGKIDSVIVVHGSDEERNKEAIRIVKSIPEWSVIFWRGKQIQIFWYIFVEFGNKKDEDNAR
jgi:hypothetical protein